MITGVKKLQGANLKAPDLRAGAALVIAAMSAEGFSTVESLHHIDRGYEHFEEKLKALGADITRVSNDFDVLTSQFKGVSNESRI